MDCVLQHSLCMRLRERERERKGSKFQSHHIFYHWNARKLLVETPDPIISHISARPPFPTWSFVLETVYACRQWRGATPPTYSALLSGYFLRKWGGPCFQRPRSLEYSIGGVQIATWCVDPEAKEEMWPRDESKRDATMSEVGG